MWSNNDGMGPTWAPLDNDDFVEYMNGRKIHYLNTHPNHFNTVHVTDWAHDFYRIKQAEKERLIQEAEARGFQRCVDIVRSLSNFDVLALLYGSSAPQMLAQYLEQHERESERVK